MEKRFAAFVATTAVVVLCLASGAEAARNDEAVVLETPGLMQGEAFACRIPVDVRYEGTPPLKQINVVAEVYAGDKLLGSTGVASGDRPLIRELVPGGAEYVSVPMQFDLTPDICREIDGLRISFARCVFGDLPAENCLSRVRFAGSEPNDPLFLALDG